jgi:hypothetical protein
VWLRERAKQCALVFNDRVFAEQKIAVTPQWDGWDGELRDSKTRAYKLFADYIRPIGETAAGNEAVHQTAATRFGKVALVEQKQEAYNPVNLRNYLEKEGSQITT